MKAAFKVVVAVILLVWLSGCGRFLYLTQAVNGHCRLMRSRVPVEKVLNENPSDTLIQNKLWMAYEVRDFASREMGLPQNKSYKFYSDIKREYVGWNVYCAPKFSVEPVRWIFPIAGRVVYRGYFHKKAAIRFAAKMEKKGYDVYVSPIDAYSTLGWYNDPVLSSNLQLDSIQLAGLIIHEMAHQQLYLKGDSQFSESFAVAVERAGVKRWLKYIGRKDQIPVAQMQWAREDAYNSIMFDVRSRLNEIYTSGLDKKVMAQKKDSLLQALLQKYPVLKKGTVDNKYSEVNNAWFVPISTYYTLVPKFQSMLDSVKGNFPKFYKKAGEIGK